MELGFGGLWLEAGVGSEADDQLEPRARVSVWPGRPNVRGIVAPEPWGARGAECLLATSSDARLRRQVGVRQYGAPMTVPSNRVRHHGSSPPRERCAPRASRGSRGFVAPLTEFPPGLSKQLIISLK